MEKLKDLYEEWILNHEWLFLSLSILLPTLATLIVSAFGAWVTISTIRDSRGIIKGKALLADESDPSKIVVKIYQDEKLKKTTHPNASGEYTLALKNGNYSINVSSPGYINENIPTITTSVGTFKVSSVFLKSETKVLKLKIVDKNHSPYKSLTMSLKKNNDLDSSIAFLDFDKHGKASTPKIDSAEYSLDLMGRGIFFENRFGDNSLFLWRKFKYGDIRDILVGKFYLPGSENSIEVIFPKVLHTNIVGFEKLTTGTIAPDFESGHLLQLNAKLEYSDKLVKIAQSVHLDHRLKFCGIGFSTFSFAEEQPIEFELTENNNGRPGKRILSSNEFFVSNFSAIPSGDIAYSEFCHVEQVSIEKGVYWLVHTFKGTKDSHIISGIKNNHSREKTLYSVDDGKWKELSIEPAEFGINEIGFLFVE